MEFSHQPPAEATGAEGEGQEAPTAPATPPDLSEAIRQQQAQQESLQAPPEEGGVPPRQPAFAGELYEGDEFQDAGYQDGLDGEEPSPEDAVQALVDERLNDVVGMWDEAREVERREGEIRALAEQYPRLREPEVLESVGTFLDQVAQEYGDPALRNDPRMVQVAYLAHEALEASAAEGRPPSAEAPAGAKLETGAGPGAPPPQVDPQAAAYLKALNGDQGPYDDVIG